MPLPDDPAVVLRHHGSKLYLHNTAWGNLREITRHEATVILLLWTGVSRSRANYLFKTIFGEEYHNHERQVRERYASYLDPSLGGRVLGVTLSSIFDDVKGGALPTAIDIAIASNCNFRCTYCYFGSAFSPHKAAPVDKLLKLVDEAADLGVLTIYLSGGEPTAFKGFTELTSHILMRGMVPAISTNGFLLSDEKIDALAAAGLRGIQFSIDSFDRNTQEEMTRTKNTLGQVIRALRRCIDAGIKVRTKTVLTKSNVHQVREIAERLLDLQVGVISFTPELAGSAEEATSNTGVKISTEEMEAASAIIREIRHQDGAWISLANSEAEWKSEDDIVSCGNLKSSAVIHWNGAVSPCEMIRDEELVFGNAFESGLEAVWNSSRRASLISASMSPEVVDEDCAKCSRLAQCRTGCFNLSKLRDGRYFSKDPRCGGPY